MYISLNKLFILFIFLYIFNKDYCVNSQKENITLIVDIGSSINYVDYKCGGSFIKEDNYQYPPCKSFNDVGYRSNLFNQQFPKSNNTNLIVKVIGNGNDTNITNENVTFGNLIGFCTFEILTNGNLIIDGSKLVGSNNIFINYLGLDIRFSNCRNGKKWIKLTNITFINWNDNLIFSNSVTDYNYNGLVSIWFDKVITDNSNRFIGIANNGNGNYDFDDNDDSTKDENIIMPFTFNLICCNFINSNNQNNNFINIQNSNFIVKSSKFINQSVSNSNLYQFKLSYIVYFNVLFDNITVNQYYSLSSGKSGNNNNNNNNAIASVFKMVSFILNFNKITIDNSKFSKLINGFYNDNFNGVNYDHSNIINNLFCNCKYRNNIFKSDQSLKGNGNGNKNNVSPLFQISMPVLMNSYGIVFVNNSFTNNTIVQNNNKAFLSIEDGFNVQIMTTELPADFSIAFDINNSNISVDHHSNINSNILVQGDNNSIQIEYEKTPNYTLYNPIKINSTCINCDISYININDGNNHPESDSEITIKGFSSSGVDQYNPMDPPLNNSDDYKDNDLFNSSGMKEYSRNKTKNIILHIALPIVLGSIFLSIIFLGLAFRKKIFFFISKERSMVSKNCDKIENEMHATCETGGDSPTTNDDVIETDEENDNGNNNFNENNINNKFNIDYQYYVDN